MQSGYGLPQRGAVLPLVAICLAVLMGFAGMAIDIGFLEYQQQAQQAATDAAAMGGAQSLHATSCANGPLAEQAAVFDAGLNGYSSSYVSATSPPSSGYYAGNVCAVQVKINAYKPSFFSQVLGFGKFKETTEAVGITSASTANAGCIYLLSTTDGQSNLSNINMQIPTCNLYINTSANMSNSTIDASYIGYASGTNNISGTTFSKSSPAPMPTVADPCSTYAGCAYLTKTAPPTSNCSAYSGSGGATIGNANSPTCYTNFSVSGTNTVCGLIWITGSQFHIQGSTLTSCSTGVTFALAATVSDVNMSTATLTLSAPTTGNTAQVVLWRNSAESNGPNFSNCTCKFTGMVYFPTAEVDYSSATGTYAIYVFGQANFSTTNAFSIGTPPPGYGQSVATLGE